MEGSKGGSSTKQWTIAMMVAAAGALAACGGGGGGGGGSSGATPAATPATPASINLAAACSGSNCGALGNTYAGSGVGVWQATNTGGSAGTVNVSIAGLTGQNVTLIYTNQGAAAQPMPSVSLTNAGLLGLGGGTTTGTAPTNGASGNLTTASVKNDAMNAAFDRQISEFNAHALDSYATGAGPLKTQGASNDTVLRPQSVAAVGAQRTWNQPVGGEHGVR